VIFPGIPVSSTKKINCHDIAEILLKVALKHQKIKSKADYINNHILNVFKYIFNIQLIIKLQIDFLNGYFSVHLKCTANGISVQNVNVLPNIYGHIFEISLYI
jgi:hypothetical protein